MLNEIITNKVLVIPICAWGVAQLTKMLVALLQGNGVDLRYLVSSGGMPSAHSAVVTALATSIGMIQGFGSVAFGIAAILALVVMYDAAGIRQAVSQLSIVLNHIIRELRLGRPVTGLEAELRELIGHTPFQVIVGAAIGITIAWLWIAVTTI